MYNKLVPRYVTLEAKISQSMAFRMRTVHFNHRKLSLFNVKIHKKQYVALNTALTTKLFLKAEQ